MASGEESNQLEQRELEQLKPYALRSAERRHDLGDQYRQLQRDDPLEFRTE